MADEDAAVFEERHTGIKVRYVLEKDEILTCLKHSGFYKTTGLRAIVEETLLDTMFKLPSRKDIAKVIVDEATVSDRQPPQLIPVEAAGSHKKATPLHSLAS